MTGAPPLPAPASELIDRRYSCRTYLERPIAAEDQAHLSAFMATRTAGPFGSQARFGLIAAAPGDRQALRRLGTYGFIKGATGFIAGAVRRAPKDLEDYGYLLEEVILCATGIGLGTCWLGGTFTRSTFVSRFGGLRRGETMPAVVSTGYIGDDGSERIRAREEGNRRFPPAELFFEGRWGEPLPAATRGAALRRALEAVRMAPSATNKQPWRIVRVGPRLALPPGAHQGIRQGQPSLHRAAHRRPAARRPRHRHVPFRAGGARGAAAKAPGSSAIPGWRRRARASSTRPPGARPGEPAAVPAAAVARPRRGERPAGAGAC